jgi:hypothetical protein
MIEVKSYVGLNLHERKVSWKKLVNVGYGFWFCDVWVLSIYIYIYIFVILLFSCFSKNF